MTISNRHVSFCVHKWWLYHRDLCDNGSLKRCFGYIMIIILQKWSNLNVQEQLFITKTLLASQVFQAVAAALIHYGWDFWLNLEYTRFSVWDVVISEEARVMKMIHIGYHLLECQFELACEHQVFSIQTSLVHFPVYTSTTDVLKCIWTC